uniref:Uncharacterized protein n=1 Tax=Anguilla anguilla TaxID=7936 RepID=A0A0E9Q5S2_ANGAN
MNKKTLELISDLLPITQTSITVNSEDYLLKAEWAQPVR